MKAERSRTPSLRDAARTKKQATRSVSKRFQIIFSLLWQQESEQSGAGPYPTSETEVPQLRPIRFG